MATYHTAILRQVLNRKLHIFVHIKQDNTHQGRVLCGKWKKNVITQHSSHWRVRPRPRGQNSAPEGVPGEIPTLPVSRGVAGRDRCAFRDKLREASHGNDAMVMASCSATTALRWADCSIFELDACLSPFANGKTTSRLCYLVCVCLPQCCF